MEKDKLNKELSNYIYDNITPLKEQRIRIKKLYKELKDFLGSNKCFQTGSYARHTSVRPVDDLDIFYVFGKDTTAKEISNSLEALAKELAEDFHQVCSEEFSLTVQTHSVKLQFGDGFSIDIVPAIETSRVTPDLNTTIYIVPVESSGEWVYSDPRGYKEITKKVDEMSDKNLRKAVRFIKACRGSCKEEDNEFKLKSFHIERILIETFVDDPSLSLYESIKVFFEDIPANLINARFPDRADNSIYIDKYVEELTFEQRSEIIDWSKSKVLQFLELESVESDEELSKILNDVVDCSNKHVENIASNGSGNHRGFSPSGLHTI